MRTLHSNAKQTDSNIDREDAYLDEDDEVFRRTARLSSARTGRFVACRQHESRDRGSKLYAFCSDRQAKEVRSLARSSEVAGGAKFRRHDVGHLEPSNT